LLSSLAGAVSDDSLGFFLLQGAAMGSVAPLAVAALQRLLQNCDGSTQIGTPVSGLP
jgi:hypothetical protein